MLDIKNYDFIAIFSGFSIKKNDQTLLLSSETKFDSLVAKVSKGVTLKTYQCTKVLF